MRALAVLLVVGYHAFPSFVKAGFIGVDIFFVISGYLIGGVILTNLQANEFTYRNFYFRRILRIFPALIVVFCGVFVAGYFCLLPDELKNLGLHIFAGGFFCENILLWKSTGYFDAVAHATPLLNLWSLGIEEQFYIFFPLLLLFCWKKRLKIFTIVTLLALISLTDCVWLRAIDPIADFYSPLTRFWELLAGCMLKAGEMSPSSHAVGEKINKILPKILHRDSTYSHNGLGLFLACLGLFGIGFAMLRITQQSLYPGWLALFPVCATVCLIAAGKANPISHYLFCNSVAVFIGQISYPLYLWHWPLLSFAWIINGHLDSSTRMLRVTLVFVAFLLASLTYFFVERPIRLKRCLGRASIPILVGCMVFCCCAGLRVHYEQGFPKRSNMKKLNEVWSLLPYGPSTNEAGLKYAEAKHEDFYFCKYNDAGQYETIAIFGDSHADAAYPGIAKLGEQLASVDADGGYNTLCLAHSNLELFSPTELFQPKNSKYFKKFLDVISQHPEIKKVFLITLGMRPITGIDNRIDNNKGLNNPSRGIGYEKFKNVYKEWIDALLQMGKEVVVVAENPVLNHDIRSAIKRDYNGLSINYDRLKLMKKDVLDWEKHYLDMLKELDGIPQVDVLYPNDIFCPDAECIVLDKDGLPLYRDDDHLTVLGSDFQAQRLIRPWLERKRHEKGTRKILK